MKEVLAKSLDINFYKSLVNDLNIGIIASDSSGNIDFTNKKAADYLKISVEQLTAKTIFELFPEHEQLISQKYKQRKQGIKETYILETTDQKGEKLWLEINSVPYSQNNKVVGSLATVKNINKQIIAELEMERYLSKLQKANKTMDHFAYIVSHDLKAPLRSIQTLTHWLKEDYNDILDDEGKEHLDLLKGKVSQMQNLIEGVLQFSRIGRKHNTFVNVDLNKIVKELISKFQDNAKFTVDDNLPIITADPLRIYQLFEHLFKNAIQFNQSDNKTIKLNSSEDKENYTITITDNGIGVNEKYHQKVFDIFYQIEPNIENDRNGLGLTLAKKIVEHYNGNIEIDKSVLQGTSIIIKFPKKQ